MRQCLISQALAEASQTACSVPVVEAMWVAISNKFIFQESSLSHSMAAWRGRGTLLATQPAEVTQSIATGLIRWLDGCVRSCQIQY